MTAHIENRERVLEVLREELFGPSPQGAPLDCQVDVSFEKRADAYAPRRQQQNGEEILQRDRPLKRYGIGVLYPRELPLEDEEAGNTATGHASLPGAGPEEPDIEGAQVDGPDLVTSEGERALSRIADRLNTRSEAEEDDFDLATVNEYRASTMAVTFLVALPEQASLNVQISGGRYSPKTVKIEGEDRVWWLREAVTAGAVFGAGALMADTARVEPESMEIVNAGPLKLEVVAFTRPRSVDHQSLVTVCLVNRSEPAEKGGVDSASFFQAAMSIEVGGAPHAAKILPYPEPESWERDEEELSLDLVYRNYPTFAVGHGCAADWRNAEPSCAEAVIADSLPVFEAPNITADIPGADGEPIGVSMAALAGLKSSESGFPEIDEILSRYQGWIDEREVEADTLPERFRATAHRHIAECRTSLGRVKDGIEFLRGDPKAMLAFELANEAMLLQQIRVQPEPRRRTWDARARRLEFSEPIAQRDPLDPPENRGYWRPFQIAFLLSCVRSVATSDPPDREAVELIWFPTGGGKTEAYLALTAFSLFHRRLIDSADTGVDVLMRYTLRLLTAQQFQRASSLICAMEHMRRSRAGELGHDGFSIGIWVGGGTTPNDRAAARRVLGELEKGRGANEFLLTRCPWCSGQIGPIEYPRGNAPQNAPRVEGYAQVNKTVVLRCADNACPFSESLPVYVVDEDIYEERPSLVIGTVDKFAQLAWRPEARSMFGLEPDGSRSASPPSLIIQDELHLISGPLGSMVGIYEAVIHELCTDRRGATPRVPKIISSTATIRRYEDQIKALYARDKVYLFPPRGLDAGDSFFASYARDKEGEVLPGRKYVGIHGGGLGSVQTAEVRTFAALLQAPVTLSGADRDPWWTLMIFFNSLRELGTSLTLFQSDIPDYLKVVRNRLGLEWRDVRRLWDFLELTGRLSHEEIPRSIARLEVPTTSSEHPVDACLASSIIEVGIDIERLSVMAVVGQPKTTAQYIQVTGRVGRKWWERPGLIATIYSPSKPRDRSHFEKFRSYHERLYAQVEPTSVTPFSPPVLERALHAVLVAYVRQAGGEAEGRSPWPYPEEMIDAAKELLAKRACIVDPEEAERLAETFDRRARQWRLRQLTDYRRNKDGGIPLLLQAGAYATATEARLSWQTPVSLRNVDAECQAQITQTYIHEAEADAEADDEANDA